MSLLRLIKKRFACALAAGAALGLGTAGLGFGLGLGFGPGFDATGSGDCTMSTSARVSGAVAAGLILCEPHGLHNLNCKSENLNKN